MLEGHFKTIEKFKESIFLLCVFVLPLSNTFLIFCFVALLLICLVDFFKSSGNKATMEVLLPSALLLLSILSLFYTEYLDDGIKKTLKNLAFVLVPACFFFGNFSNKLITRAKSVFLYSWVLFCIIALIVLAYNWFSLADERHFYNFIQTSIYHNYMPQDAMYINTALIFLLFSNSRAWFKLCVSAMFLSVLIFFGVRLGLLTFFAITITYILLSFKKLVTIKNLGFGSLLLILAFFLVNSNPYTKDKIYDSLAKLGFSQTSTSVSEIGENYHNISLRASMWSTSLELILEKPIIGYGVGSEKRVLHEKNIAKKKDIPVFHSHNQFLSIALQYGILGLLIFVFILVFIFWKSIHHIHYILISFILVISMITDSYLDIQQGIIYFAFLGSFILSQQKITKANTLKFDNDSSKI